MFIPNEVYVLKPKEGGTTIVTCNARRAWERAVGLDRSYDEGASGGYNVSIIPGEVFCRNNPQVTFQPGDTQETTRYFSMNRLATAPNNREEVNRLPSPFPWEPEYKAYEPQEEKVEDNVDVLSRVLRDNPGLFPPHVVEVLEQLRDGTYVESVLNR